MKENSLEQEGNNLQPEVGVVEDSQAVEDRTTKKVRLKEGTSETDQEMMLESETSPKISWKDKLLGTTPGFLDKERSDSPGGESVDDLEFLEGDFRTSVVNGTPAIDFSERIQQILFKEMDSTVIIKLLGRSIGYAALSNRLNSLWNPSKSFHLMDIENGYYLVKLHSIHDYTKVLSQGPWLVYGQYLTVQPWTKEFRPSQPFPSIVMAWIRLPGLPGHLYKKKIIEKIGGLIGKVVRLDLNTDSRTRGRFARMAVYINLNKPLTAQVLINGMKQRVEYESLPAICFNCGKYGHTKDFCPLIQTESSSEKTQAENTWTEVEKEDNEGTYGPWMMVDRKFRSHMRNNNFIKKDNFVRGIPGSRFQALAQSGGQEEMGHEHIQKNKGGEQSQVPRGMTTNIKEIQLEGITPPNGTLAPQSISTTKKGAERPQRNFGNKKALDSMALNKIETKVKEGQDKKEVGPIIINKAPPSNGKDKSILYEQVSHPLVTKDNTTKTKHQSIIKYAADPSKAVPTQPNNGAETNCAENLLSTTKAGSSFSQLSFNVLTNGVVAHAINAAGPSITKLNSSINGKGSKLSETSISFLIPSSSNITESSIGNNGTLSSLQSSCVNPLFDFQDLSTIGDQAMTNTSGTTMPSMSEDITDVPLVDLNSYKHTAVSFKEKGPVDVAAKNRSTGKLKGPKKGSFKATRKVAISPYGKGNIQKISNSITVPLTEAISNLAKSISIPQKADSEAPDQNSGCASSKFIRAFREYNNEYKPDIVCLLEPRVSGQKAYSIIDKLGFERSHRIESNGFSGGIWVGWKDNISISIIYNHPQFMLLRVKGITTNDDLFIFVVYGSPNRTKRKLLWNDLLDVLPQKPSPWMVLGDFNAILSPEDKKSNHSTGKRCKLFGKFVESCNLQDLKFIGPSHTWQRGNTFERLDRALANDDWMSVFPYSLVYHLPRIKSDHRPILFKTSPEISVARGRPFRFLAGWTKHANFKDLVSNKWRYSGNMAESLSNFTSYVKDWNRYTYGYIGTRKKQLMKSLGTIQKALDQSNSRRLANLEMEVRDELESVLNHEDLLWRQKARCDWLQFGDRNTKFFHTRTIQRRNFNRILALRISNGEWCSEQETLREEAVKFFEELYGECPEPISDTPSNIFTSLKDQDIDFLKKPILNDEIKKALFDMAPLKAPGSDGYHAIFFQSQWDLVGGAVCEWVQGIFAGKKIDEELNNTLIVLIPKKSHPEDFSQFRPISLCSVLYKLVMKVIANRFKVVFPNFISPEQAGFIAGRNISDNVIIAQEVIHSMRSKKASKNWMAIKLDLEKAYDRISWEFIHLSLVATGIPEGLRKVIMNAISSSTMQILWNGVPSRSFKPVRGIRQGCPLSPYLFVLSMEWLGNLIRHEMRKGRWNPIRLSRSGPDLSHLFFADDLVIFGKADMGQAHVLKDVLQCFCALSGHRVSPRKSNMFFSKGVDIRLQDQISQFFGFQKVLNLGKYLGIPLLHDRITKSSFNFVIDKVRNKLQNWDARKLSLAGRITLAQSVLLAIPSYLMQSLVIPKGVCDEIEMIVRQFIWGSSTGKSKPALVGWESICQPKTCGGLGLRYLHDHNTSFLMKIGFNLVSRKEDLWVRVLRSKYGWKSQIPDSIHRSHCSHLWRSLSKAWPLISENLLWSVGNGETIRGWKDNWIPKVGPLLSYVPASSRLNLDSTLKDWVLQEGSWNIDMLNIWLPEEIIKRILSIPPPHPAEGEDRIIWARTEPGNFTIRSAYRSLKENTWRPNQDIWKTIWKYQGPQRVRLFLWLVANQRILTNSERTRRGFGQSNACSRCGHDVEDIMHVLRDCPTAKDVWTLVVPSEKQSRFFSDSLHNWLSYNLSCHLKLQDKGITWSCLFGILAWRLWKNRNLFIFQNIDWTPLELIKSSLSWSQNFEAFITSPKSNATPPKHPQHSSGNWVFLFSDGAVARDSGTGAAGGVVRDRDGRWVLGYSHYLGKCSPLEAELWGILDGVFILINKGYKKIKIRSDNLEMVRILSTEDMTEFGSTLIRRIKRLLSPGIQWEIKHIPRENNLTADHMAKIGLCWQNSLQTFDGPPDMVATIFQHDKSVNVL
ncbi:reverse transcriptase [Gossypium australe]|uniref:Reverse transcriptase n=1 Tax=Gossypium australe TaxID=47621 RepID=A0A5B6WYG7_9ROSI|nr:reverse transcriptase [Gossypium australe]